MTTDDIREYRTGDEERIVALFNAVFGKTRTVEHWRWQFANHPQGSGWITLAKSADQIVAQYCMMRYDINSGGKQLCAGQSCDTMVAADQRGKRWFVRLADANYAHAVQTGLRAVFGFPNRNSFPGFVRSLDWHRVASLKQYHCRIGFEAWGLIPGLLFRLVRRTALRARAMRLRRSASGATIQVANVAPEAAENLLSEVRNYEILSVWKDLAYLRWRYQNHPVHEYSFHQLIVNGQLDALIVSRRMDDTIAICEVLHRHKNVLQTAYLLNSVLQHYQTHGVEGVVFFGHDEGFHDTVFEHCGFQRSYSSTFVFGGRVFGDARLEQEFILPHNWTVVYGDTDLV